MPPGEYVGRIIPHPPPCATPFVVPAAQALVVPAQAGTHPHCPTPGFLGFLPPSARGQALRWNDGFARSLHMREPHSRIVVPVARDPCTIVFPAKAGIQSGGNGDGFPSPRAPAHPTVSAAERDPCATVFPANAGIQSGGNGDGPRLQGRRPTQPSLPQRETLAQPSFRRTPESRVGGTAMGSRLHGRRPTQASLPQSETLAQPSFRRKPESRGRASQMLDGRICATSVSRKRGYATVSGDGNPILPGFRPAPE